MKRPTTHKWLPFYFWILLGGIGPTIIEMFKALNIEGNGGYIFIALVLITIRATTCWGIYFRKTWGWYLNFGALFAIPVVKVLVVLAFSGREYGENIFSAGFLTVAVLWLIYAIPNAIYFNARKHLFDDGEGLHQTMFGQRFKVLDPQSGSGSSSIKANEPSRTVKVLPVVAERITVAEKIPAEVPVDVEECVLGDEEMEVEMASINLTDKSDEQFYEIAAGEYEAGKISTGLMLKAEVAAGGDKDKLRRICIGVRAQELARESLLLADLRNSIEDAVRSPKQKARFLDQVESFRASYPANKEIEAVEGEFGYQEIKKEALSLDLTYCSAREYLEKRIELCESFLEKFPNHPKWSEVDNKRSECKLKLEEILDKAAFRKVDADAGDLIRSHKYQEAASLYKGYLNQYSEYAEKARKMVEETIPKLIEDEPRRKRRVKLNLIVCAIIIAVLVVIIGFSVLKAKFRFTVVINGTAQTVTDNLTGLEWVQAPHALPGNSARSTNWNAAVDFCNNLVYAGQSDWRLPSVEELKSLASYRNDHPALPTGHPFVGVQSASYWSSTSYEGSADQAWYVAMDEVFVGYYYKANEYRYVWPVRGGKQKN